MSKTDSWEKFYQYRRASKTKANNFAKFFVEGVELKSKETGRIYIVTSKKIQYDPSGNAYVNVRNINNYLVITISSLEYENFEIIKAPRALYVLYGNPNGEK
jgi:hypothetical protein